MYHFSVLFIFSLLFIFVGLGFLSCARTEKNIYKVTYRRIGTTYTVFIRAKDVIDIQKKIKKLHGDYFTVVTILCIEKVNGEGNAL